MTAIPKTKSGLLFEWRQCGRSWIADIGALDLEVNERGSLKRGDVRWRVRSVLGAMNFGDGWHENLRDALLEAEAIAVREAIPALRKIVAARSRKGSRP